MHDRVDQVEVWACRVPLAVPLNFGAFTVQDRHYVAVRIRTADGLMADVIGHSRGSPVDVAIADLLAPRLIGADPWNIRERRADFLSATAAMEHDGVLGRAWSLLELALQGLAAQACQLPVWQALGGSPRELPVQLVEGYPLPGEVDEAFAERLIQRTREGFSALKIAGGAYADWNVLCRRLRLIREQAPRCRLVVDFAWAWRRAADHAEALAALSDLEVDWIEDPFPRDALIEYAHAARLARVPIGGGDEATRAHDVLALADHGGVGVCRVDATALGGYSAVLPLIEQLRNRGRRVSLHDFAEVHQHCALAAPAMDHIEMFPTDRSFDVRHMLTTSCAYERVERGRLAVATEPGLGITLNPDPVARYAVRHRTIHGRRS